MTKIEGLIACLAALFLAVGIRQSAFAENSPAVATDVTAAGKDYAIQGEYVGQYPEKNDKLTKHGVHVIALGDGKFQMVRYRGGLPGDGWDRSMPHARQDVEEKDGKIVTEADGLKYTVSDGVIEVTDRAGKKLGELKRVERKSPTLGVKPPKNAVVLFDGSSANEFNGGTLTADKLLNVGVVSKQKFDDFELHLEFRTPFMPKERGQGRGNSGMYLQDRYEVQILDSFGLEGKDNECGGIYSASAPKVNMCYPPLAWQTYDVDFKAARYDESGKKIKNAVVTVRHNGVVIHENLELPTFTPGGEGKESPGPGPIQLQNHGNPVHFRNIWVVPKQN